MHQLAQHDQDHSVRLNRLAVESAYLGGSQRPDRPPGILIAEDEKAVFRLLQYAFARDGWRVFMAKNGAEAVELFREHEPLIDVLLLDVQMPVMSGTCAWDKIRAIQRDIPCLIMTGNRHSLNGQNHESLGVVEILDKPFDLRRLVGLALNIARPTTRGKE
ncbi:MAG: response regulator [Planctomycetota bacterium]